MSKNLQMMVAEPITTLTDYAIALEAFVLAGWLWHRKQHASVQRSVRCWAGAFAATAIAALLGGTCHGFVESLGVKTLQILWQAVAVSIAIASFLIVLGTVISTISRRWQWIWLVAISIKAIAHVALSFTQPDFQWVIVDYGSALLLVGVLQGVMGWRGRSGHRFAPYSKKDFTALSIRWIRAGIIGSWVAIGILGMQWQIGWLQANDLYHLGQMIALIFFYRGALLLKDQ
ncbi:MAG: hypothetical protein SFY66_09105 [Oculatellaceae cyanobacterium bins.114]|nr:hypothetical protein [Oculatellaceae cyanobacterium bins.114]